MKKSDAYKKKIWADPYSIDRAPDCARAIYNNHSIQALGIRPTLAANFYQTNGVRKFFFRSNETSTHKETIYNLGKIFNRRKICYEFSKLGEKSSFFGCKVRDFEFSKKNFCMHVVTLETYKMYSNKVWFRSTIWPA